MTIDLHVFRPEAIGDVKTQSLEVREAVETPGAATYSCVPAGGFRDVDE